MDYKHRVKAAIEKYHLRQEKPQQSTKRKNDKPEVEVQKLCLEWMRSCGFDVNVIESKAVFNPSLGRYLNSQASPGMSDCIGNDKDGIAVYVEFKAPGRRSTLRENQLDFLKRKINLKCFSVVVSSHIELQEFYQKWLSLRAQDSNLAQQYLLDILPKKKATKDSPLFEE